MQRVVGILLVFSVAGCNAVGSVLAGGGWQLLTVVLGTAACFMWKIIRVSPSETRELVTRMKWHAIIILMAIVIVVIGFLLSDKVMNWLAR